MRAYAERSGKQWLVLLELRTDKMRCAQYGYGLGAERDFQAVNALRSLHGQRASAGTWAVRFEAMLPGFCLPGTLLV